MKFVNPLELLEIKVKKINLKDLVSEIKKAKQRKSSEVDFSDNGYILFDKKEITKDDINKYAELLNDSEKKEYYLFLTENQPLSRFLQSGNPSIFNKFSKEAIYKDNGFVSFISPFFSDSYSVVYLMAFTSQNKSLLQKMNRQTSLISKEDFDDALQKTKRYLEQLTDEVKQLSDKIENEGNSYNEANIIKLSESAFAKIDIESLNLVNDYLQTQRNQLARSLRGLSVSVFNVFDDDVIAIDIIKRVMDIRTDGLVDKNIIEAHEQLLEIHEKREQERQYQPQLDKFGNVISKLANKIENIESKKVKFNREKLLSEDDIIELNNLPDSLFTQIRNQVALAFISLSVAIWETTHQNLDFTYKLAETATKIKVDAETSKIVSNSLSQLQELKSKKDLFKRYSSNIEELQGMISNIESKVISPSDAMSGFSRIVPVGQINKEGKHADDLKDTFCHLISNLSVAIFNEFHDSGKALAVLFIGKEIDVSSDGKDKLEANYKQLYKIVGKELQDTSEQLMQVVLIFSNLNRETGIVHPDNVNQEQVLEVFRDVLSKDVLRFISNATVHSDLQHRIFEECKKVSGKLKKKYALIAIEYFEGIGNKNSDLKSLINQFKFEQENRSSGFWNSIFGS
jgi:uncharacterized protein YukE